MNNVAVEGQRAQRRTLGRFFEVLCLVATCVGIVVLLVLLVDVARRGLPTLSWEFLTSFPSRNPQNAGIKSAIVGSLWLLALTALFALPTGIAAGVWLEEYARKGWVSRAIEVNISNLAGVPSIIYGLMALGLFVYQLRFGHSILAGGLTLAFLILPIVSVATR